MFLFLSPCVWLGLVLSDLGALLGHQDLTLEPWHRANCPGCRDFRSEVSERQRGWREVADGLYGRWVPTGCHTDIRTYIRTYRIIHTYLHTYVRTYVHT